MQIFILPVLVFLAASPLYFMIVKRQSLKGKKISMILNIVSFFAICVVMFGSSFASAAAETSSEAQTASTGVAQGLGFLGAALVTGASCIGAGIAVAGAASAALGAISENEKMFGKAFVMVVLAEGIAIYGLLISIQILNKI